MTAQTSEHGGLISGLAAEGDAAGDAVSTAVTRDHVINGILHGLDSSGQFLANFAAVTASEIEHPASTEPTLISGCNFFFPLRVRHGDDSSFRLAVYLRGGADAAGTVTYRVVVRAADSLRDTLPVDPASFASTSVAEVATSTPAGEDLYALLYLNPSQTRRAPRQLIESEDGTGDSSAAVYIPAAFQIWAKSSGAAKPRVLALTVLEYPGER